MLTEVMGKVCFKYKRKVGGNSLKAASKIGFKTVITTFIAGSPNLKKDSMGDSKEEFLCGFVGITGQDIQRKNSGLIMKDMVRL